jgi:hypothetical protein
MRARRGIAIACVLGLLAGVATAGPVAAGTTAAHFTAVGPGVEATWVNGDITTSLLVFHQLNAPGSTGFFEEVLVVRDGGTWLAVYDSWDAPLQPTITIHQPLRSASVVASIPLVTCEGDCPAGIPSTVDVAEAWTGVGPIERVAGPADFSENDPGVLLVVGHQANFLRDAVLADADPFDGDLAGLGTLESARFFDVHLGNVIVCHPGAVCL